MKLRQLANRRAGAGLAALVVAGATAFVVTTATNASADDGPTKLYIVQVVGDPVAGYEGGVAGIPATKPDAGEKVDAHSTNGRRYRDHLNGRHREVRRDAGIPEGRVNRDLNVAFNGFTASLTAAEVAKLEQSKDVLQVWPNEILEIQTSHTPDYLGLTGRKGVWQKEFGGAARR